MSPPMSNFPFRAPNSSDSGEHSHCNALQFQPTGQQLNTDNGDDRLSAARENNSLYGYPQQTPYANNRPHLSYINTDIRSRSMTQGSSGSHRSQLPPFQTGIPEWTVQQMAEMMYPTQPEQQFVDYSAPNIYVDTVPPPCLPQYRSGPLSPYDSNSFEPSPTTPNFPSSPSCSSGYQSSSPFGAPLPLTPNSAQAAGRSPMIETLPIPPSPYAHERMGSLTISHRPPPPPKNFSPASASSNLGNPSSLGPLIPQRMYRPHTTSDRRRYVEEVRLEAPIVFELQNPQQSGISLRDALTSRFMRLVGRDDLMFEQRGPSVSIRLEWLGYQAWSRQIPTRDFRSPPGPITRSKLAKNVAKSIERFIAERKDCPFEPDVDPRWRVGPGFIDVDDLVLVSLHHVSMGSWQANLRLAHPQPS